MGSLEISLYMEIMVAAMEASRGPVMVNDEAHTNLMEVMITYP
jgi:hypothetical protein